MKTFTTILKVLAVLLAIAGIIYVIATYGDKIVAFAKKLLHKNSGCECEDCECNEDGECCCDCDCDSCDCGECDDASDINDTDFEG